MKTISLLLAVTCAIAVFTTNVARGFSISAVTISPSNVVPATTELRMTINITTPSQGTWLYAPTQIASNSAGIRVDVFPTSGPLAAIGSLRETVPLGAFPMGTHHYEVVIHPNFQVNWGTRTNRGSFTVQSNLPLPEVSIGATVPETIEPSANTRVMPGEFTITRVGDTNEPLILFVEFTGTATFGQDYQEVPRFLVMPAGSSQLTVLVGPLDDSAVEGDETVIATLSTNPPINSLPNYTVHSRLNAATVVIHDNDVPDDLPVVSIGVQGFGQTLEPCPVCFVFPGVFTVSRTGPTNELLTVYLEYDGPATSGLDYHALPHQVTIPAGTNSAHLLVLALDDRLVEGPEIVRARIALPELATLGYIASFYASEAMVVINDDEPGAPEARLDIAEPKEGALLAAGMPIAVSALGLWTQGEVDRPVEFFAGNLLIGRSNPPQLGRPTIPGLPSVHTILWTNPPPGQHVLTARTKLSLSLSVTSPPVRITVGPEPQRTVVRIEATHPIAEEDSIPFDRLNLVGVFTISRSGPTNNSLPVYVQYSGSAIAEEDYPALPWVVSIPAGATSTQIRVEPVADGVPEGIETLFATISNCPPPWLRPPCYDFEIEPAYAGATVFIRDDGITRASLVITNPKDGAKFDTGEIILIEAIAIDLDGYISRVEFFDGNQRIGESEIVFIRPPDPGTPIQHSFEWSGATVGVHALTARDMGTHGDVLMSPTVRITVGLGSNQPPEVAITRPVNGTAFPTDATIEMVAGTRDPDGYVRKMEFFADRRKVGESSIEFIHPPDPGQTQTFTFVWRHPGPGPHSLTARATDDSGADATSAPVNITVAMSESLPIVTVVTRDAWAVEPASNSNPNTATFRVRRFGPTDEALVVAYSLRGTAENGIDYDRLPGLATIPAGRRTVLVTINPRTDELREGRETIVLRLEEPPLPGPANDGINPYRIGWPRVAVALINDSPSWSAEPRCVLLPGRLLHVCFAAENGHNFRLEASSDLRNWETLGDSGSSDGVWHFIDPEIENHSRRFYRLTPEPVAEVDE